MESGFQGNVSFPKQNFFPKSCPTMRAGGLGGTRRARAAVSAKAFSRFVGWLSHQAANASRWAVPCTKIICR